MTGSFTVECEGVRVEPRWGSIILIHVDTADLDKLVNDAGYKDLLDIIGKDKCAEYFDLVEASGEE